MTKRNPFPPQRDPVTPASIATAIAYGIALGLLLFSGVW